MLTIALSKPVSQLVVKKEQDENWETFPKSMIGEVLALYTAVRFHFMDCDNIEIIVYIRLLWSNVSFQY